MASKNQNFLRGALSLSIATALVKIIGALYKVPIQNLLGEEGSSLYSVAYNIYAFLFVLATAGLPVAISKMVSESAASGRSDTRRIFSVAFTLFLCIGTAGALFMFFGADWLAGLMNAEDAAWAIRAVAPSVFLVVFICPYRGVYQGHGDMKPTAVSQVIEAFGKLVFGTGLTFLALKVIIPADGTLENARIRNTAGSAMAILGVSAGILFSAVYLILRSRKEGLGRSGGSGRRRSVILREMVSVAIPITLGSAVLSVTNIIDTGLTRGLLQNGAGFSAQVRDQYHGAYTWAITLFNLPGSFVITLAVSLIPAIAAYRVQRNNAGVIRTTRSAVSVTALIGMPAGAGFIFLAKPILSLLYGANPEGVKIAAPLLQVLGVAVIFVCIVTVTNSVLQSMGMVYIPIVTMLIGSVAKIICTYTLVGHPDIHINGAPIGTLACYVIVAILNLVIVIRVTRVGLSLLSEFVKPLFTAAVMGFVALGCYYFFHYLTSSNTVSVILAMGAGFVSYVVILLLIGGLPKRELELLPGGAKLAKILQIK
ncbi:MAG: polysaccharide biosynthesis protein [Oscillospiraceae bacterium]|nr:polysaccharide biosynthesis protein [Oscillospiraceae bacterium]